MSIDASPFAAPFAATTGGIAVRVRLQPRAGRNRIEGMATDAEGRPHLKVAVTAPPEGGKANAALIQLLAKAWRMPKSALAITSGAGSRSKTVTIMGDPGDLALRLEEWMGDIQ